MESEVISFSFVSCSAKKSRLTIVLQLKQNLMLTVNIRFFAWPVQTVVLLETQSLMYVSHTHRSAVKARQRKNMEFRAVTCFVCTSVNWSLHWDVFDHVMRSKISLTCPQDERRRRRHKAWSISSILPGRRQIARSIKVSKQSSTYR